MASGDLRRHTAPHSGSAVKLLRLTTQSGKPIYINPEHLLAVRLAEDFERTDTMPPDTVRIELDEHHSYNVRESIEYILAALEGA